MLAFFFGLPQDILTLLKRVSLSAPMLHQCILHGTALEIRLFAGSEAPLAFSPRYAAPEVIGVYEARQPVIRVSAALDIWALGVMAYELLTDTPVFDKYTQQKDILGQLAGRDYLPWEDPATKEAKLRQLRMLKRSLVKCLARDPAQRPSAAELLSSWEKLFDSLGADATLVQNNSGIDSV